MNKRTTNLDDPKVRAWNAIERDIRLVRDDRLKAVRGNDVAWRVDCDKEIAALKAKQVEVFASDARAIRFLEHSK